MTTTEAIKVVSAKDVPSDGVLVDVRTPGEYAAVHAQGATLLPLSDLDPKAVAGAGGGKRVYLLCKAGKRAMTAAEKCAAAGVGDVAVVEGGTDAWVAAGLPCVKGKGVISLERQVRIGAGILVVTGVVLGWLVHPVLFGLSAFVGAGLVFAGVTDWCGMAMVLARMPWNRGGAACKS